MEVSVEPTLVTDILSKLQQINTRSRVAEPIVADYQTVLHKCQVLDVQVGQLSRECTELREEVVEKEGKLREVADKSGKIEAAEKLEAELAKVQREKTGLVKHNEALQKDISFVKNELDKKLGLEDQLQLACDENKALNLRLEELRQELDNEVHARELAVEENEENKVAAEKAYQEKEELEGENRALVDRIKTMQMEVITKLQHVTDLETQVRVKQQKLEDQKKRMDDVLSKDMKIWPKFNFGWGQQKKPQEKAGPEEKVSNGRSTEVIAESGSTSSNSDGYCKIASGESMDYHEKESVIPRCEFEASRAHESACSSAAFSPNTGQAVATAGQGGAIFLWNPETRVLQKTFSERMDGGLMDVAFTCNGNQVLAAAQDASVRVWDVHSGRHTTMRGHEKGVNCVATNPADAARGISSGEDKRIIVWDLARGFQLFSERARYTPSAVCFSHEGNLVMSGHMDGSIQLWDVRTPGYSLSTHSAVKLHAGPIVALNCFPMSQYLLLSTSKDNNLKMSDLRKGVGMESLKTFCSPSYPLGTIGYMGKGRCVVGMSTDDKYIVAGGAHGKVLVWEKEQKEKEPLEVLHSRFHKNSLVACVWSPAWENRIVSCDKDGVVVFWDDSIDRRQSSLKGLERISQTSSILAKSLT